MKHLPRLLLIVLLVCWSVPCSLRAEQWGGARDLLRPDSLLGWQGETNTQASPWKIEYGRLDGRAGSTPLLSRWSFGDFSLEFRWKVKDAGLWRIGFPESPQGKQLSWTLGQGPHMGAFADGDKLLYSGGIISPTSDHWHTAKIERIAGEVVLYVDGNRIAKLSINASRRFGLSLELIAGSGSLSSLKVREPRGEKIFNGHNLDGWWCPGNIRAWVAQDGDLVLKGPGGNYLRTNKLYGNFTLSFSYKFESGDNSGVGIRTLPDGWPSGDGMELQLYDVPYERGIDKHSTMAIYGNMPPVARAERRKEWNTASIKADGRIISAWVNGVLVQHANTGRLSELQYRPLAGWIGFQDHGAKIRFRDIRVLQAPDGPGLKAWSAPREEPPATQVLDRLMNADRLAREDNLRSRVTRTMVAGEGEQILANLQGPGAVTRIYRSSDSGTIAVYVDEDSRPVLECAASELWEKLPQVAYDRNPVLTYLPFRKSLKLVLQNGKKGIYRIDHLKLSTAIAPVSFDGKNAGIPRGQLGAINYRHHQLDGGRHRMADSFLLESTGGEVRLAPGESQEIKVKGSGIVRWLKLLGGPELLANNDLWLEATIDGESKPAIATPVRFYFPAMEAGNHHNFVLLRRDGVANMLAMPFSAGLTLRLVNRGKDTLEYVGLTASVQPVDVVVTRGMARLRGHYGPASEPQKGRGRWIGLVTNDSPNIGTLHVDGQVVSEWENTSMDEFLGLSPGEEAKRHLSGRQGSLVWRYLLLAPVEFQNSFALTKSENVTPDDSLALFYMYND